MSTFPHTLAFLGNIGWTEIIILALLGVLIFGRRLPEVGRSIGRGIVEFKKGLSGIDDDVQQSIDRSADKGRIERSDTGESTATATPQKTPTQTPSGKDA